VGSHGFLFLGSQLLFTSDVTPAFDAAQFHLPAQPQAEKPFGLAARIEFPLSEDTPDTSA
jgi:hypothetical protein